MAGYLDSMSMPLATPESSPGEIDFSKALAELSEMTILYACTVNGSVQQPAYLSFHQFGASGCKPSWFQQSEP
uniref:Uncharacterized protein n=1 Tax=Pseudomonas marincola TaxID=437900 RepID=A0A653E674_9PSED